MKQMSTGILLAILVLMVVSVALALSGCTEARVAGTAELPNGTIVFIPKPTPPPVPEPTVIPKPQ